MARTKASAVFDKQFPDLAVNEPLLFGGTGGSCLLLVEGVTAMCGGRETKGDICSWICDDMTIGSPRLGGSFRFLYDMTGRERVVYSGIRRCT